MSQQLHPTETALQDAIQTLRGEAIDIQLPEKRHKKLWENWRWSDLRKHLPNAYEDTIKQTQIDIVPFAIYIGDDKILDSVHGQDVTNVQKYLDDVVFHTHHVNEEPRIKNDTIFDLTQSMDRLVIDVIGKLEKPIRFVHQLTGNRYFDQQIQITLAADAKASFVEEFHCAINSEIKRQAFTGLANHRIQMHVHSLAECTFLTMYHPDSDDACITSFHGVTVEQDAHYTHTGISFGAKLLRQQHEIIAMEKSANVTLNGAYALNGDTHTDFTSLVTFHDENGTAEQLVKGVVKDAATAAFQGKFHVKQKAQHTDAQMAHHALMLSDRANIYAKPELEIYADDVACAHGNTIGALDEDALFYMRQRGLTENDAKALLVQAFLGEVIDKIQDEDLSDEIQTTISKWMAA